MVSIRRSFLARSLQMAMLQLRWALAGSYNRAVPTRQPKAPTQYQPNRLLEVLATRKLLCETRLAPSIRIDGIATARLFSIGFAKVGSSTLIIVDSLPALIHSRC